MKGYVHIGLVVAAFCWNGQGVSAQDVLFPANRYGAWGYIDTKGDWVIDPTFYSAQPFSEGLAAVKKGYTGKWGYIDREGKWMLEPGYERATPFHEGLAAVVVNNKWGFIDHSGNVIIPPDYQLVSSFSEGLAIVSRGEGRYFIDHHGNQVTKESFDDALPFAEGLAPVTHLGQKMYISNSGQIQIRHEFDRAHPFAEGLAQVSDEQKMGFIDRSGNVVIPLMFKTSSQFSEGMAAAIAGDAWGYIDKTGSWAIKPKFDRAFPFKFGFALAVKNRKFGVIDKSGEWVVEPAFAKLGGAGRAYNIKDVLKEKIEKAYLVWRKKGEFEKSADYALRMESENQSAVLDSLSQWILAKYGTQYVDFENAELGVYNADEEYFYVFIPGTMPTRIEIPIEEAIDFKTNWATAEITDPDFLLAGENLILNKYAIQLNGKVYDYAISEQKGKYFDFADLSWIDEIAIPEIVWSNPVVYTGENQPPKNVRPGFSDVDTDIPVNNLQRKNTFALIVGNEDYKSFQAGFDEEVNVSFAAIDAEIFSQYVHKTMGVPKKNITLITNGTAGQIKQGLNKMRQIARAYNGAAELIFYYAGHGLPDVSTGTPYLIPVDVDGSDLSFAISLDDALNTLTGAPHTRVTVFLDACFTGGSRGEQLVASRGVKIKPKSPYMRGNLVVFTATSGNEAAFAYEQKGHGMFTYFLLKKLQQTQGNVTYFELAEYLQDQLPKNSIVINNKIQTPQVMVSPGLQEEWEEMGFIQRYELVNMGHGGY